jgi:hypothetical protein
LDQHYCNDKKIVACERGMLGIDKIGSYLQSEYDDAKQRGPGLLGSKADEFMDEC